MFGIAWLTPAILRIAGYALAAILLSGTLTYAVHRYNESVREEVRAEARANAETNRLAAEAASRELSAEHAKTEAVLRRRVAVLRAAQSDACSEAKMLPQILEALK